MVHSEMEHLKILIVVVAVVAAVESRQIGGACGVEASSKLVHHNPWTVFLEYLSGGRLMSVRCGATLIDRRHVVTAAHCVTDPAFDRFATLQINARLGEYDLQAKQECVEGVCTDRIKVIKVESIVTHPAYAGNGIHDIAILRLAEDAPYTDFIRPVCLPSGELKDDATFIAAGWGIDPRQGTFSHIKKIIPLPFFKTESCRNVYGKKLPDSVICAGGQEGIDTCSGDSGGPLVWMKEKAELWGVTSVGNVRCGLQGVPAIYTRVVDYVDWIHDQITKLESS